MKLYVAFFLVLITLNSGVAIQGQTPPRKGNQGPSGKPRNDTVRICQGLALPDGYVVIAYMTSSACPHGAYLLKKQADYESAPLTSNNARTNNADESARSADRSTSTAARTQPATKRSVKDNSAPRKTSTDPAAAKTNNDPTSTATTRPRRVGFQTAATSTTQPSTTQPSTTTIQPEEVAKAQESNDISQLPQGPPTLLGSQQAAALRPPTLNNMGAQPAASPSSSPADPASTGPEEVSEGDVVRVDTTLVTVPVSVLDRQGRFIPNLKREDFSVFENGVEQAIAYFEPAEKPFTVALLLDTSASTHFHLSEIREAAIAFAKQLRPQDRVLIVSFNDEVLLLTEVTNDLNLIEAVIEENATTGNSTRLYDAVDLTIRERLNKIKGRKAMVLFTDGVDTSSQQAGYLSTLREVEELDALIYPIQYDTSDYIRAMQGGGTVTVTTTRSGIFGTTQQTYNVPMTGGGVALPGSTTADYDRADKYLHSLAEKTGGRLYQANDTKQLADAFTQIAEELRRQYTLGYYPKSDGATDNDRRQIRVKVRQGNLAVKARDGYVKSTAPSSSK